MELDCKTVAPPTIEPSHPWKMPGFPFNSLL